MTKVININESIPELGRPLGVLYPWPDEYVYIGRPGRGLSGPWGNPIEIGKKCQVCGKTHDRTQTIACYRDLIMTRIKNEAGFAEKVRGLQGKTLVCFCKPKACHGDILAELADSL